VDPERSPSPRRRDAVETRERILRVAGAAFAQAGPVSFDEIAGRAGVSRATVYRHFADRRALGAAVVERGLGALRQAVAEREPVAFRDLLHTVLATAVSLRGLADLVEGMPEREQRRHVRMLVDVLTPAFRRAQAAGELRRDVDPADLGLVLRALHAAGREPDGQAAALRLLGVLMDGLFVARAETQPPCVWMPGLLAGK
jgi:AcrR family transcriptional regulator